MLDPVTLGILLAVLAVIVAIIFYLFSGGDERDFEKVRWNNFSALSFIIWWPIGFCKPDLVNHIFNLIICSYYCIVNNTFDRRSLSELTMKIQALSTVESSNKQQMTQLANIRLENETLKSALTKSSADAADASKMRSELEAIKGEQNEYRSCITKLETELKQQIEINAKLQNQQAVEFESLRAEFALLESSAHQMKSDLDEKSRLLNQSMENNVNIENLKHVEAERDEITKELTKAKNEWREKEESLMAEYTSLKKLVEDLNKEVANFEIFKKEQDDLERKLLAKEAELAEKSARLDAAETEKKALIGRNSDRSSQLEIENTELKRCVEELKKQLEMVVDNYKKEWVLCALHVFITVLYVIYVKFCPGPDALLQKCIYTY
uniref:M protein repeat protein n=1 Tax=Heterorhabditis bacteriophora TaxID=37862 RepID=A0A1I7X1R7_HETBA